MATLHTPVFSFPYPDGTERVMDGDNAIGALAQAVETALQAVKTNTDAMVTAWDLLEPQRASASADLTLGTAAADVAGVTYTATPTILECWLYLYTVDFDISVGAAGYVLAVPALDGVVQAGTLSQNAAAVGKFTTTGHTTLFPTANAAHTVKLQAYKSAAGITAVVHATHTRATLIRVPRTIGLLLRDLIGDDRPESLPTAEAAG